MSNFDNKDIQEYRGVEGLVAARVTQDDKTAYTTGEVFDIAGVAEISKTTENSSEAHYYDNMPAIVISSTGNDTITCTVSAIPLDVLAEITGQIYNKDLGALIEGKREQRYFALGYKTKNTKGEEMYVWRYKGMFSIPDSTHSTENAGTDANGQSLVFTGISTNHKFDNKEMRSITVNSAKTTYDLTTFFDKVTTYDDLIAKKCKEPTARPTAGDIYATDHIFLTCETENSKVYYTTDGTEPSETSLLADDNGFTINANTTVKAIAIAENFKNSEVVSFEYTIKA